ncbi:N-acetyltransferase [Pandoraea pneumonica]|jgi:N-acetylglutamate synthase-like GNAT family acetyltransferase|uniref:N-acetyltransferase n=1 Tax=Pandoraea pneumonica TaxID=2508299 RepID=A0A5E4VPB2_9BURK|nr:GNAT family N-acetyltransferase [Pandoraea pneumonica]VVE14178.1 N-acetyltransferase [Pandoraea pneumonica]
MPSSTLVRIAAPSDRSALQSLYRQLVDDDRVSVTQAQIQALADDSRARLFVAEVDGAVRGTVIVTICPDAMYADQPFAVVENIVVDTQCRGSGVGYALLREVEQFCLAKNCSKMMLLSSASRADAHQFFERSGFRGDIKRGFVKYRRQFAQPR